MSRPWQVWMALAASQFVACATPTLGAEQRAGVAGLGATHGFATRTAVALGLVPREGMSGAGHVEMSSGYDTARGAEHGLLVMAGFSTQPTRIEQRCGLEVLGEFGGPVVGAPAGEVLDVGARAVVSLHLSRRTIDDRNRVYSLALRNVILTFSLRGAARIDTGLVGGATASVTGLVEAGIGIRFQLGTDIQ